MAHNLDVVVNCLKRHYELLVRMAYLDPAVIQHPPSEGWSDEQLAVDVLRVLARSEGVINLLRHLPYLRCNVGDEKWEVYPETRAISYLRDSNLLRGKTAESRLQKGLFDLLMMPFAVDYPPGMVSLTFGRDATFWIIDTEEWVIFPVGSYVVDDDAPEEQPWRRNGKARGIQEYFDEIYSEILTLAIVPTPQSPSWEPKLVPGAYPDGQPIRRLLREHGWPDAFQKDEYLQAVRRERMSSR